MHDSLDQWLSWLETLHPKEIALGLERVRVVQAKLGLMTPPFAMIVVGGTNGKGSTVAMLETMYHSAGYHVGAYSSPHLMRFNERIRIDGVDATDAEIVRAFEQVERGREDVPLTYFEFGTLAAAVLFRERGVQVAVLEVGLGGRLDAVNAFDADVAIVTSIGLDHQEYLGCDRESIAREKAGIFRAGRPALCGDPEPPGAIADAARRVGAELLQIQEHFGYRNEGDAFSWHYGRQVRTGLPLPAMCGVHQLRNAACALLATELLRSCLPVSVADVRSGLATRLAARFEVRPRAGRAALIFDVAHNGAAAATLADNLRRMPAVGRTFALCGILRDKAVEEIGAALVECIDEWHVASLTGPRGAAGAETAERLRTGGVSGAVSTHPDPASGFREIERKARPQDRIVVFGSFLTVSAILREPQFMREPSR
ncbi:MAG: bifunctional tetrahydrofolate synthase/dihydrofolate synthase [Acidiferrobacteraceae bacterium]